jgi:hypothetical protein
MASLIIGGDYKLKTPIARELTTNSDSWPPPIPQWPPNIARNGTRWKEHQIHSYARWHLLYPEPAKGTSSMTTLPLSQLTHSRLHVAVTSVAVD